MSETRRCGECRYFDRDSDRARFEIETIARTHHGEGFCRFNAPTAKGWPRTGIADWCGEWTAPRTRSQAGEDLGDMASKVAKDRAKATTTARQAGLALTREARR